MPRTCGYFSRSSVSHGSHDNLRKVCGEGAEIGAPGQCGAFGGSPSFTVLNSESEATFFHFILHHGNVPRGNSVLTTGNFKK